MFGFILTMTIFNGIAVVHNLINVGRTEGPQRVGTFLAAVLNGSMLTWGIGLLV